MVSLPNLLFNIEVEEGDGLTDNYLRFSVFRAKNTVSQIADIGYNRNDKIIEISLDVIDNGVAMSVHIGESTTDYQNTTLETAYAIISLVNTGPNGERRWKIYSAPTTNSIVGATEVFDSDDLIIPPGEYVGFTDRLTSNLVPIQPNHFIVVENVSGASSRLISTSPDAEPQSGVVIEQG